MDIIDKFKKLLNSKFITLFLTKDTTYIFYKSKLLFFKTYSKDYLIFNYVSILFSIYEQ